MSKSDKSLKILFVCEGNICRSPMAQVIFSNLCKRHKKRAEVKSAGTFTMPGFAMTQSACDALEMCGEGVARPISTTLWHDSMTKEFDHIVCMANHHARAIDPRGESENVYTLDSVVRCGDIPDPWLMPVDVYVGVCRVLQMALAELYKQIFSPSKNKTKKGASNGQK